MIVGVANQALRAGLPVEVVFDGVTPEAALPRSNPRCNDRRKDMP